MIPRFKKSRYEPKPIETDYWIDLNENEYGGVFKYYDNNAMVWKQTESITREKEPQFTNSPAFTITTDNINYWNNKVGIEDFDALKEEIIDLGSKYEGVTVETLDYYNDILQSEISKVDESKADKATTLKGYGIQNAYTKKEVDTKFDEWKVDLPENVSYFKNDAGYITELNFEEKLPNNIVSDANYVHTDNNYTTEEKNKLSALNNYNDADVRNLIQQNTNRINNLSTQVDSEISATVESMSKELAKKANLDEVYTRTYLDELFTQFVKKTHKTYGFVDDRPTAELTTNDTGFIFYDYTVNEPLLWVADEWRLLRTNEAFDGFLLSEDISKPSSSIGNWEFERIGDDYCRLVKYTGEYSTTIDLEIPNEYSNLFVLRLGDTMEYWAGKQVPVETHQGWKITVTNYETEETFIVGRKTITLTPDQVLYYETKNINPGYYIPGTDDDPTDDIVPEDILINYISDVFGNASLIPNTNVGDSDTTIAPFKPSDTTIAVNSFSIPKGIRHIGPGMFTNINAASTKELEIPNGVETIGDWSFATSSITDVKFPRNPVTIGTCAFAYCNLKSVTLPATLDYDYIKKGGSVYCFAYSKNTSATNVTIAEGAKAIPACCFYLTKTNLKALPKSLEYIGQHAFYGAMTNVSLDLQNVKYLGYGAFRDCTFTSLNLNKIEEIGPTTFLNFTQYATTLSSMTLSPNLKKIYPYSLPYRWYSCAQDFAVPPLLEELPYDALRYCGYSTHGNESIVNSLDEFGVPIPKIEMRLDLGNVRCLGIQALFDSRFTNDLVLPETLEIISMYSIARMPFVHNTKLIIPKNVKIIGGACNIMGASGGANYEYMTKEENQLKHYPISKSGYSVINLLDYIDDGGTLSEYGHATFYLFGPNVMKEFEVDPENKWFKAIDGVLFDITGKRLVGYPCAKGQSVYEVPEGCVYFDNRVFSGTGYNNGKFTITLPSGETLEIDRDSSYGNAIHSYQGEGKLKEVVLANTTINYSPRELVELFPTSCFFGGGNMLVRSQDYITCIEKFSVKEDHPLYRMEGDWLVSKDGTKLEVLLTHGMKGTYRVPDCVTEIAEGAIYVSLHDADMDDYKYLDPTSSEYTVYSHFYYSYLIIPPSVVTIPDQVLFELNVMAKNSSTYTGVVLEDGNPAFIQDPVTNIISRR